MNTAEAYAHNWKSLALRQKYESFLTACIADGILEGELTQAQVQRATKRGAFFRTASEAYRNLCIGVLIGLMIADGANLNTSSSGVQMG